MPLNNLSEVRLSLKTPHKKIINAIAKNAIKPIVILIIILIKNYLNTNLGGSG